MAVDDSVIIIEGSTAERIATDFITAGDTAAHYQYMKVAWGADGTATPVSATTGTHLPVQLYIGGSAITSTGNALDVNLQTSDITVTTKPSSVFGVTVGGYTESTIPVLISGTTAIGGAVGVTGNVAVTGSVTTTPSTVFGVTVGGYTESTIPVLISGTTAIGGAVGVTGDVAVTGTVSMASVFGVTVGGYTESTIPVLVSGTTALGGAIGVTGDVTVSSTDLDIRGLSFGILGASDGHVIGDSVVIQGACAGFPVTTLLSGASGQGLASNPIGSSGDALKVAVVGAAITATVSSTDLQITTTEGGITIGEASGATIGITFGSHTVFPISSGTTLGITGAVDANITNASLAVTSTNLDIRGIIPSDQVTVFGWTGADRNAGAATGLSGMPALLFSHGGTAIGVTGQNQDLLHVRVEGSGITNVTSLQIQGRNDGSTLFPIGVRGVCADGLLGVTFANTVQTVVGAGATANNSPYINTLLVGVSAPKSVGNEAIVPVGISGGALNVNLVNSDTVTFSATVDANTTVTNAANAAIPVHGATTDATAIYVSGTAGSTSAWPIFVQGYTTGDGTDAPIGVTFEFKHELQGLSGGLTALHNALVGVTQEIGGLASTFTTTNTELGNLNSNITNTNSNLNTMVSAYVTNDVPSTIPVSIVAPTSVKTYQFTASTSVSLAHGGGAVNATPFSSGIKIRLHPDATQGIFIGGADVTTSTGYLLSPGDDIFIEQQFTSTVGIITTSGGSNMTVYVIGY